MTRTDPHATDAIAPGSDGGSARFALADWGTSRLRIWLCDGEGRIVARARSDRGMAACRDGGPARFREVFEEELSALGAPSNLPAVVSGMAGARGGWSEAGYLPVPAAIDRLAEHAVFIAGERTVAILPGLSQADPADVMRGEEVQIAGCGIGEGTICLPGTHSKWARLENGRVASFRTIMTGELFSLLSRRSLLADTLDADHVVEPDDAAFLSAVRRIALEGGELAAELFSIRAGTLLKDVTGAENAARLSGLLIGAELAAAPPGETVRLIAEDRLAALYGAALGAIGRESVRLDADAATRRGLFAAARIIYG